MSLFDVIFVPKGSHACCAGCESFFTGTPAEDYEMMKIGNELFCEDCLKELITEIVERQHENNPDN